MRVVPFTTRTGLQIGCRYNRPAPVYPMSKDALRLQVALLNDRPVRLAPLRRFSTWNWIANAAMWTLAAMLLISTFWIALVI